MGGSNTPPATLPNPRHADLVRALAQTKSQQGTTDTRLDAVTSAMTAKAWTGGTSDEFMSGLTSHKTMIHNATQGCVDNVSDALRTCPATVPNPQAKAN